jgi:N-acetylglucosamine kinase-like BadF-type ATPase
MTRLFAGVDGGQSATRAVVADERGAILGRGASGPCDEIGEGASSRRLADAVEAAVAGALRDAGLDPATELEAVVAALSGYEGTLSGEPPRLRARRLRLLHDAPAALAGAVEGPGIVLICGTGSVAYGEDAAGATARAGGWGFLFGDRGSAFWIARRAVSEAMAAFDAGRGSALGAAALAHFAQPDLRALAGAYYAGGISRARLASFAAPVGAAAEAGDGAARAIVETAAAALAELAACVRGRLDLGPRAAVALCGGGFAGEALRAATLRALGAAGGLEPVPARAEPAIGALRLAYREAGLTAGAIAGR